MCFTVNVNLVKEELENRYGATLIDPEKYRPSYYYHAFGLPEMPVICSGAPSGILQAHTISPLVNDKSANRNTPEVISPYKYNSGNLLF